MPHDPSDQPLPDGARVPPRVPPRTAVGTMTPPPPPPRGSRARHATRIRAWRWYVSAGAPLTLALPILATAEALWLRALGFVALGIGSVALCTVFALLHGGRWLGAWRARRLHHRRALSLPLRRR